MICFQRLTWEIVTKTSHGKRLNMQKRRNTIYVCESIISNARVALLADPLKFP